MRASRNLALDVVRREKLFRDKESEIIASPQQWPASGVVGNASLQDESYYLLNTVLREFEARLNHSQAAATHFRKSLQVAELIRAKIPVETTPSV